MLEVAAWALLGFTILLGSDGANWFVVPVLTVAALGLYFMDRRKTIVAGGQRGDLIKEMTVIYGVMLISIAGIFAIGRAYSLVSIGFKALLV